MKSSWPWLTLTWPLTLSMHYTSVNGSLYKIYSHRAFLSNLKPGWFQLTPAWPLTHKCTTLWSRALLPNLVVIGHSWAIWPLAYPSWPLHDHWPHKCTLRWSRVFPIEFGGHGGFWAIWPLVDPVDPYMTFDPGMHCTSVRGSSYQVWLSYDISYVIWPLVDLWPLVGSLRKINHEPRGPCTPTLPNVSLILRSAKKRIAGQTHKQI